MISSCLTTIIHIEHIDNHCILRSLASRDPDLTVNGCSTSINAHAHGRFKSCLWMDRRSSYMMLTPNELDKMLVDNNRAWGMNPTTLLRTIISSRRVDLKLPACYLQVMDGRTVLNIAACG